MGRGRGIAMRRALVPGGHLHHLDELLEAFTTRIACANMQQTRAWQQQRGGGQPTAAALPRQPGARIACQQRPCARPRLIMAAAAEQAVQQQQQQPAQQQQAAGGAADAPSRFLRPHLLKLAAYTPIEPFEVLSARYGRSPQDIVKLDANENPYGPPPEVRQALATMPFPHIYPDPESRTLRAALAEWNDIPAEHLLVGCGADELIDLLMRCTLDPGDAIVDCPPTFTMYVFDADVNGARVVTVPRLEGFRTDVEGIKRAVEQHAPKIVFLTSPNNPDGSVVSDEELAAVLALPVLVVLDEAYIEFATDLPSRIKWVQAHDNLVVLRTFSKCAALAGMRVGYGAFPKPLIEYLWRAKQPYNVSVAAEVAACAALTNKDYLNTVRDALLAERACLFDGLASISWLTPYPSQANFILCKVEEGRDAKAVKDALAQAGIMVRHYAKKELSGYIRISVGKPEHTDALMAALRAL